MSGDTFDLVVIGAGPGGYVCAIRAAQLGLRVACVEKDATLGGTCLNVGCIPSKALLESTERFEAMTHHAAEHAIVVEGARMDLPALMRRKDGIVAKLTGGITSLFAKNKVRWVKGSGRLAGAGAVHVTGAEGEAILQARAIVIATGSVAAPLRGAPYDGTRIVSSTEALSFPEVPGHLVVVGAGVIGLELGSVWRRLGARVTVLEYLDRVLPGADLEVAREAQKILTAQGFHFELGARVTGAHAGATGANVAWTDAAGQAQALTADRVLVAVGRSAHTEGLGCAEAGVKLDAKGRVEVDAHLQTTSPGVFAIGDVIAGPMLAHKAEDEGILVAERLAGGAGHVSYDAIPSIVYTHPEIAWVGETEDGLAKQGIPHRVGRFRYAANGRAMALGETQGFVKMLAHAETDRVLGCHVLGARAGDLIAEMAVALEFKASAEDIARSVHAHPTLAEIVREAALDVDRRALHK